MSYLVHFTISVGNITNSTLGLAESLVTFDMRYHRIRDFGFGNDDDDHMHDSFIIKQGVALTGRNGTGPPCIVGRPTAHASGGRPDGGRTPTRPVAGSVTDDDRRQRQTPASKTILAH